MKDEGKERRREKVARRSQGGSHRAGVESLPDAGPGLPVPHANGLVIRGAQDPGILLKDKGVQG